MRNKSFIGYCCHSPQNLSGRVARNMVWSAGSADSWNGIWVDYSVFDLHGIVVTEPRKSDADNGSGLSAL